MRRGLNLNNSNMGLMTTVDMTGHRVLGMGGSLTKYIHTGNAGRLDSFTRSNPVQKKKFNFEKQILQPLTAIFCAAMLAIGIFKGKNKIKIDVKDITKGLDDIKEKGKKLGEDIKANGKKKLKNNKKTTLEFRENLKSKFKKNKTETNQNKTTKLNDFIESIKSKFKAQENKNPIKTKTPTTDNDIIDTTAEIITDKPLLEAPKPKKSTEEKYAQRVAKRKAQEETKNKTNYVINLADSTDERLLLEAPKQQTTNLTHSEKIAQRKAKEQTINNNQGVIELPEGQIKKTKISDEIDTKFSPKPKQQEAKQNNAITPKLEKKEIEPEIKTAPEIAQESISQPESQTRKKTELKKETEQAKHEQTKKPKAKIRKHNEIKYDKSALTHQNLKPVEPMSESDIEDFKILCGYDKQMEELQRQKEFNQASLVAQKEYREFLEKQRRNSSLQNKIDIITDPQTGLKYEIYYGETCDDYKDFIPDRPFVFDKSNLTHDSIKPVEPLSAEFLQEARNLSVDGAPMTQDEATKYLKDVHPRFSFAEYIQKPKKMSPFMRRFKAEIQEEKMEHLNENIKAPKRPRK